MKAELGAVAAFPPEAPPSGSGQSGSGPLPSASRQVYVIGVLLLMYIFAYMDRNVLALMVDPIKRSLGITDVQFSLVHGFAFGAFYAVFGLPMGYLVDRFSRRWVLFSGISFWSLCSVACGLAVSFPMLALARFGVGAGEATLVPAAYSTITRILPRHRAALGIAIFSLGSALGGAIAVGAGGFLLSALNRTGGIALPLLGHLEPWQAVFVVIGAPGLIVALLAFTIPERPGHGIARDPQAPVEALWPFMKENAAYLSLMIGCLIMIAVLAIGVGAWLPALFLRQYGQSVAWVGVATSLITLIGIPGFLATGFLSDSLFRRGHTDAHVLPLLWAMPAIIVAAFVGFYVGGSVWLVVGCALVTHILAPLGNSIAAHVQLVTPPALRGRMAAIKVAAQHLCGLTFGPLFVALVTDHVLHDPRRVGEAMGIVVVVIGTIGIVLLWFARGAARAAVERSKAWDHA